MHKWLSIVSLILSVAALALSIWTFRSSDRFAEQALQRRERLLVEKYKPSVVRITQDFGVEPPAKAETLDELFEPLFKLMTSLAK